MRLGLPVLEEEKSCSLCMQTIDVFGDHAACCAKSSDRIHRHNRVRNLLDKICQEGMLSPDKSFKGTAYEFAALVFETTGGVNEEGLSLLRQLFRFAAKHQSLQLSVYCGRAWARLSCSLQSSVSQCFLNRSDSVAAIEKDIDFVSLDF
jgi:hypothetical protein